MNMNTSTIKIVTTVGTSIFTNLADREIQEKFNQLKEEPYSQWDSCKEDIEGKTGISQRKGLRTLVETQIQNQENASAEITSILKIIREIGKSESEFEVYLLATDTVLGALACELIKKWFENYLKKNINVIFNRDTLVIAKLRVDKKENYEQGIMNLIEKLDSLNLTSNDVLNITGGYKAIIPIMTIYAQIKQIPLYYIYNEQNTDAQNELVSIGTLPIQFDAIFAESYYPYIQDKNLLIEEKNNEIFKTLEQYRLIKKVKDEYSLTPLGKLYKSYINQNLGESKQVLGLVVEYKLLEHYLENPYICENGTNLTKVERGKKDDAFCAKEIDLVLSDEEHKTIVIGEVKSYLNIYVDNYFDKVKKQITEQVKGLKKQVQEYVLFIYMNNTPGSGFDIMNEREHKLQEIQKEIQEIAQVKVFRVFLIFINHNEVSQGTRFQNIYMHFIQNKLNIREYNLNSK